MIALDPSHLPLRREGAATRLFGTLGLAAAVAVLAIVWRDRPHTFAVAGIIMTLLGVCADAAIGAEVRAGWRRFR